MRQIIDDEAPTFVKIPEKTKAEIRKLVSWPIEDIARHYRLPVEQVHAILGIDLIISNE